MSKLLNLAQNEWVKWIEKCLWVKSNRLISVNSYLFLSVKSYQFTPSKSSVAIRIASMSSLLMNLHCAGILG